MQEKKKRNRILMLLIVGMLLIYAFTDIENVKINRERKIFFSSARNNRGRYIDTNYDSGKSGK